MNEPKLLIVYWRSPRNEPLPIGRLLIHPSAPRFEFSYVEGVSDAIRDGFHPFPEFPDLDEQYCSDEMFALFANRLMADSQSEYPYYVSRHGLDSVSATEVDVLLRTDGRRATDHMELFALPTGEGDGRTHVSRFFVRAIDRVEGAEAAIEKLQPGDRLDIVPNEVNGLTVGLKTKDGRLIGYMPNFVAEDASSIIGDWLRLTVAVVQRNAPPAPSYHRLLCRLDADSPISGKWTNAQRFRSRARPTALHRST